MSISYQKIISSSSSINLNTVSIVAIITVGIISCVSSQQQPTSVSGGTGIQQASFVPSPTSTTTAPKSVLSANANAIGKSVSSSAAFNAPRVPENLALSSGNEAVDMFDGKNPFSDDTLWRIPVHLVRGLSASGSDQQQMQSAIKSDKSKVYAHDDYDDDDEPLTSAHSPQAASSLQSSSSSPIVIAGSHSGGAVASASLTDLKTAAGYHFPSHGHHGYGYEPTHHHAPSHHGHYSSGSEHYGPYFQYASVPSPYAWDFGYRRGNPYHTIERYEHGKGPHFQTKVKWSDKNGGYGVQVWDYNHDDHHSHHYGGGDHYDSHSPSHYGGHHGPSAYHHSAPSAHHGPYH